MDKPASEAPITPAPAEPTTEPADEAGFGDFGGKEIPAEEPANDMPNFEKEPFDAGVDADEETDPKKFIEQLSGKLGQSLRQYTEDQGQPDFELEKFAINSVISATHTAEMDEEDRNDIIKKIEKSGENETQDFGDENQSGPDASNDSLNGLDDEGDDLDFSSNDETNENDLTVYENVEIFLNNPKKNNMFQPNSNDILDEMKPCWKGYKQVGMKEKNGKDVPNCVPVNENNKKNLINTKKISIFNKKDIKMKLKEVFNHEEPLVLPAEPKTKPKESPMVQPSRRNKPFLPERETQPDPKAED